MSQEQQQPTPSSSRRWWRRHQRPGNGGVRWLARAFRGSEHHRPQEPQPWDDRESWLAVENVGGGGGFHNSWTDTTSACSGSLSSNNHHQQHQDGSVDHSSSGDGDEDCCSMDGSEGGASSCSHSSGDGSHDSTAGLHALVEQTIRDGIARRYSRNTYCLAGDFLLSRQDMKAIVAFLTDLPNAVTRLVFLQTQFSLAAMKILARQFLVLPDCRIQRLMLSGVPLNQEPLEIMHVFFAALAQNTSIVELVIHDTYAMNMIDAHLGPALAKALSSSPQLKFLTLRGMNGFTERGLFHLSSTRTHTQPLALQYLTELCLRDCKLDCSKVAVLFRGILGGDENEEEDGDSKMPSATQNTSASLCALQSLDMSNNHLRAPSLKWFAKFLLLKQDNDSQSFQPGRDRFEPNSASTPSGLQLLSLTGNKNLFDNANAETQQLANALAVNTSLKRLVLERCGLNGHTASLLFHALETNQTLQELNIRINSGIGAATTTVTSPVATSSPSSSSLRQEDDNQEQEEQQDMTTIISLKPSSTLYYSHMIQSLPRLAGLQTLAFDALFPQLDQSLLLRALEQNITLVTLVAHYGLDQTVQNQVNAILRRNQLYQKIQPLMYGTIASSSVAATPAVAHRSTILNGTQVLQPQPLVQHQPQVETHPQHQYSRGMISHCLAQWVQEMKNPRSYEHEQVGASVLYSILRKFQPWG